MVTVTLPQLPAIVEGKVSHARRGPVKHRFTYRVYQWLVDCDDLPRMPRWLQPFSTFKASDHMGNPQRSISQNVLAYCAAESIDTDNAQVIMLANARVLGYTFDPLTVFWVLGPDHSIRCIIAEVHNTYGERHRYLIGPDDRGRDRVNKAFYVSPFFTVDGFYDLTFGLNPEQVSSTVVLHQNQAPVFAATFSGTPRYATPIRLARVLVTYPLMTQRTTALIRLHGIWLWLRRLPIMKRPTREVVQ